MSALRNIATRRSVHVAWRVTWVAVRLILVFWMAETGRAFIYQGF